MTVNVLLRILLRTFVIRYGLHEFFINSLWCKSWGYQAVSGAIQYVKLIFMPLCVAYRWLVFYALKQLSHKLLYSINGKIIQTKRKNKLKNTLTEMRNLYSEAPTSQKDYKIENRKYIVTRHFIGDKDIDKVIYDIANSHALEGIRI